MRRERIRNDHFCSLSLFFVQKFEFWCSALVKVYMEAQKFFRVTISGQNILTRILRALNSCRHLSKCEKREEKILVRFQFHLQFISCFRSEINSETLTGCCSKVGQRLIRCLVLEPVSLSLREAVRKMLFYEFFLNSGHHPPSPRKS